MEYLYGFFYADPVLAQGGQPASEARLFYVAVQFPYLPMDQVRKKIEERYGPPNGENIKDNQGALVWDSAKTTVIMWVDRYEKKPFCRKINYVGKDLAREINEYQTMIFNKTELEILKKLNP
jgi:hypothetical protein